MKPKKERIVITRAIGRWLLISPRKANLVAGLIRGKTVQYALSQLEVLNKKGAKIIAKILKSAVANAKNVEKYNDVENLKLAIQVGSAGDWKRLRPRAFGRANIRRRRRSHIWIELYKEEIKKDKAVA